MSFIKFQRRIKQIVFPLIKNCSNFIFRVYCKGVDFGSFTNYEPTLSNIILPCYVYEQCILFWAHLIADNREHAVFENLKIVYRYKPSLNIRTVAIISVICKTNGFYYHNENSFNLEKSRDNLLSMTRFGDFPAHTKLSVTLLKFWNGANFRTFFFGKVCDWIFHDFVDKAGVVLLLHHAHILSWLKYKKAWQTIIFSELHVFRKAIGSNSCTN